jgi:hypothetical protein
MRGGWGASLATFPRALLRWDVSFGLCSLTRVRWADHPQPERSKPRENER